MTDRNYAPTSLGQVIKSLGYGASSNTSTRVDLTADSKTAGEQERNSKKDKKKKKHHKKHKKESGLGVGGKEDSDIVEIQNPNMPALTSVPKLQNVAHGNEEQKDRESSKHKKDKKDKKRHKKEKKKHKKHHKRSSS